MTTEITDDRYRLLDDQGRAVVTGRIVRTETGEAGEIRAAWKGLPLEGPVRIAEITSERLREALRARRGRSSGFARVAYPDRTVTVPIASLGFHWRRS